MQTQNKQQKRSQQQTDFDLVYATTAPRLVGQLYLLVGNLAEAQDCVQEAFAKAWSRWDSLSDGRGDPVGWVKVTAYRLAISRWRSWKAGMRALARHGVPPATPGPSPDAVALRDALAKLPKAQRTALIMHHLNDMRVDDIARELGVAPGTVKARLARGRAALADLLTDWHVDPLDSAPTKATSATTPAPTPVPTPIGGKAHA
ncbi:SigE family RNA polymerase sigma factor [Catenulispora yoronensis]|uniref:SigE family RNA polymerase sigma factor n=1 Tax=Catenulispora yoronensis TaxID=450799 RepID=UPI0031D8D16B